MGSGAAFDPRVRSAVNVKLMLEIATKMKLYRVVTTLTSTVQV